MADKPPRTHRTLDSSSMSASPGWQQPSLSTFGLSSLTRSRLKEDSNHAFSSCFSHAFLAAELGDLFEYSNGSGMSVSTFDANLGKVRMNDAPLSGLFSKEMSPPWASMMRLQMLKPKP